MEDSQAIWYRIIAPHFTAGIAFKGERCTNSAPILHYATRTKPLQGTRVASIIEFGRMVHAEMSSISDAARRGLSVLGATLYCTTFPCHMCARHIIATGLREVVYIEPYPKSMAKELYKKSIRVDHDTDADDDAVVFRPFVGIAPRRYIDLFTMVTRKDDRGHTIEWKPEIAPAKITQLANYNDSELVLVNFLDEHRVELKIRIAEQTEIGERNEAENVAGQTA